MYGSYTFYADNVIERKLTTNELLNLEKEREGNQFVLYIYIYNLYVHKYMYKILQKTRNTTVGMYFLTKFLSRKYLDNIFIA